MITMNKLGQLRQTFFRLYPQFGMTIILIVGLAIARYFRFDFTSWGWLLQISLFVLGALFSHTLFLFETNLNQHIDRVGWLLAHEEDTAPIAPAPSAHSWLRSQVVLMVLPILAVYLLSSSRSALGFGFLFGLSWVYALDIWSFAQGKNPAFVTQYFPQPPTASTTRTLILGYGLYMVILVGALILV